MEATMSLRRAVSLSLLFCVSAGCASVSGSGWRSSVPPQRGPKAYIHASFTGGMFNRSVNAWFRVDRPAYVMVAHLSGEGVIRVLYPDDPTRQGMLEAGKSMRTPTFTALYDAVPSLYSFTASPMSTPGARIDSYDGFGHAYIFLIASDQPLRYDAMSEGKMWDEFEVPNYFRSFDPRASIRDFADMVSGGAPYTL